MYPKPVTFNHVILFNPANSDTDTNLQFDRLCGHLANKMNIVIIACIENEGDKKGEILISKDEFSIYSEHTPEFEATKYFGFHRYYIYSTGRFFKTALVYLTDIIGSTKVFVVMSDNLHQFITPIMLISNSEPFINTLLKDSLLGYRLNDNLFLFDQYFGLNTTEPLK
jgi:hypothetical protein